MIDQYTQYMIRRRRSPNTIRLRLFYLNKFWLWHHRELAQVTFDELEGYLYENPDWSDNTRQSASASLKAFYGWAERENILPVNLARDLPTINAQRRRPRIASETAIRDAIECPSLTDRAMIMLGAECGLRVSEIAHLNRNSRDGDWLHIVGKGGQQRSLNMSPELCGILNLIECTVMRNGYYFVGRSRCDPIHPSTAWRHISVILKSNPHSLRRRAGTIVYRTSGHNIRLAQVFLGHKNSSTTEGYLDIADDDLILASTLTRLAA